MLPKSTVSVGPWRVRVTSSRRKKTTAPVNTPRKFRVMWALSIPGLSEKSTKPTQRPASSDLAPRPAVVELGPNSLGSVRKSRRRTSVVKLVLTQPKRVEQTLTLSRRSSILPSSLNAGHCLVVQRDRLPSGSSGSGLRALRLRLVAARTASKLFGSSGSVRAEPFLTFLVSMRITFILWFK